MSSEEIIEELQSQASEKYKANVVRMGIPEECCIGVSTGDVRNIAKKIEKSNELAFELWNTGYHEARLLAVFVFDKKAIIQTDIENLMSEVVSWDLCDHLCKNLIVKMKDFEEFIYKWVTSAHIYKKRAAFTLIATSAIHNKKLTNDTLNDYLKLICENSDTEHEHVKKAVSCALREIGKRDFDYNEKALLVTHELLESGNKTQTWIAKDVIRELENVVKAEGRTRLISKKTQMGQRLFIFDKGDDGVTNKEIYNIAMRQSAIDSNCGADDFLSFENKVVISNKSPNARKYLELPFYCDLTSYGNNIVASVSEELFEIVKDYICKFPVEHCFETPNLNVLIEKLKPFGMGVCFMAEYFVPDISAAAPPDCGYEIKRMELADFTDFYLPQWSNALCEERKYLDKLAVGAFDNGSLVGLAGCSADCDTMWQIGVDVLSDYRKQGIASCLTNRLALEVLKMDIVPFYCCAWSNIKSVRNAIKSGLKPAWVQVTVKTNDYIAKMNK